jgi:hypothetical protein
VTPSTSLRALWLLGAPQLQLNLMRYAATTGLDLHSRSWVELLGEVYILVFWMFWLLAVLGLAAGGVAGVLLALGDPPAVSSWLATVALAIGFVWDLRRAVSRSPFVFDTADRQLLCPTPLDRRWVALDRLARYWPKVALIWTAGATVLAYAIHEAARQRPLTLPGLVPIVADGFKAAIVVALLQLALQSVAWAAGAWRLRRDADPRYVRVLPAVVAVLWLGWGALIASRTTQGPLQALATVPLLRPLQVGAAAAFGVPESVAWLGGVALACGLVLLGLAVLTAASSELNLARAAQESHLEGRVAAAREAGLTDAVRDLQQQARQGAHRAPTRLMGWSGAGALVWKGLLQALRGPRLKTLAWGLVLAGTGAGLTLAEGFSARLLPALTLGLLVAQRAPERLRRDLGVRWLLVQVPRPLWQILLASLGLPAGGTLLAVGVGVIGGSAFGSAGPLSGLAVLALLPMSLLAAALGGAVDLMRLNQSTMATASQLYPTGTLGLILGVVSVGGPLALWWGVGGAAGLLLGLIAGALLDFVLLQAAVWFYRQPDRAT